jgi:hypothetical protein
VNFENFFVAVPKNFAPVNFGAGGFFLPAILYSLREKGQYTR